MVAMWNRFFVFVMSVLAALFTLSVYTQLVQAAVRGRWLPSLEAWHIGILPYPAFLVLQICVAACMMLVLTGVGKGTARSRRWKYRTCFIFGGPYFILMLFRWSAALAVMAEDPSLSKALPAFFQIVLASFVLLLGLHNYVGFRNRKLFRPDANF